MAVDQDRPVSGGRAEPAGAREPLVVVFWEKVFSALAWVSIFRLIRQATSRARTPRFAEVWVMSHTLLAFACLALATQWPGATVALVLAIYGMFRVFEIAVYQTNVLLFDWYRVKRSGGTYKVQGLLRMVLLLLHNYAEIVFWFATAYVVIGARSVEIPEQRSVIGALYGSFQTMVSLGPGEVAYRDSAGLLLVWAQSLVGLLMTILVLGRFVSLLPSVGSLDRTENAPG